MRAVSDVLPDAPAAPEAHLVVAVCPSVRFLTGRGEMERLLASGVHTRDMTSRFRAYGCTCAGGGGGGGGGVIVHHPPLMPVLACDCRYLLRSRALEHIRTIVFGSRARFNIEQITTLIVDKKRISPSTPHFRNRCVGAAASWCAAGEPLLVMMMRLVRHQSAAKPHFVSASPEWHERGVGGG